MYGQIAAVPVEQLDALGADPDEVSELFASTAAVDLGKAWDVVVRVIDEVAGAPVLDAADPLSDDDFGYGPVMVISPDGVARVVDGLGTTGREPADLLGGLDYEEIYGSWDPSRAEDRDLLIRAIGNAFEVFRTAGARGNAILFLVT